MTAILRSRIRTIFSLILIFTIFTPLLSACDKSISGSEVVYGYFGLLFTSIFQGEPGGLLYALIFTPFVVGVFAIVVHVIVHLIAYVDKPKPYTIKYLIIALVSYSLFLLSHWCLEYIYYGGKAIYDLSNMDRIKQKEL